jgi:hypothetical protein
MQTAIQRDLPRAPFTIREVDPSAGAALSDFVFDVYYRRFSRDYGWLGAERAKMAEDDVALASRSRIWTAESPTGATLATIRAIEKSDAWLPIERDFGIDTSAVCRRAGVAAGRVFEIGRLAKDDRALLAAGLTREQGALVVDALFARTVRATSVEPNNVWFIAVDARVLQLLRLRGFEFRALGEAVDYLGSPTVPAFLAVDQAREMLRDRDPQRWLACFGPEIAA